MALRDKECLIQRYPNSSYNLPHIYLPGL